MMEKYGNGGGEVEYYDNTEPDSSVSLLITPQVESNKMSLIYDRNETILADH